MGRSAGNCSARLLPIGELIALDRTDMAPNCGDLGNPGFLVETVRRLQPDVIVNAAAYTAVDKAESEPESARTINAIAPRALANAAAESGALLVHYSSDYVFNGSGSAPWTEDDPTGPLNVYGRTKLEGERFIRDERLPAFDSANELGLRVAWPQFVRTMLRLAAERDATYRDRRSTWRADGRRPVGGRNGTCARWRLSVGPNWLEPIMWRPLARSLGTIMQVT